jgi:transcriptional regulator with XRE-family HTH domain
VANLNDFSALAAGRSRGYVDKELCLCMGLRIKEARCARDLGMSELSTYADIAQQRLASFEKGDLRPEPVELWNLSLALRQPISYFFSDRAAEIIAN